MNHQIIKLAAWGGAGLALALLLVGFCAATPPAQAARPAGASLTPTYDQPHDNPGRRYMAPPPAGADAGNDCTSKTAPCATIQHGVDVAQPGDEIHVADGTYSRASPVAAGQDPSGLENPKGLAGAVYYVSPAGNDAQSWKDTGCS